MCPYTLIAPHLASHLCLGRLTPWCTSPHLDSNAVYDLHLVEHAVHVVMLNCCCQTRNQPQLVTPITKQSRKAKTGNPHDHKDKLHRSSHTRLALPNDPSTVSLLILAE